MRPRMWPCPPIGCMRKAAAIEKQEETPMRLKLLSPGEMNAEQKETYDESIAGKRGAPPAPMMAWLNSPEMARHATRLGGVLRFDTIFPAKLSEIAILVTARHWTSHYEWFAHKRLALKGGMDPAIIEDIKNRRTPRFDDPQGQMIYDVARSRQSADLARANRSHRVVRLLHHGLDDAQHLRVRVAGRRSLRSCVTDDRCLNRSRRHCSKRRKHA
jgi:4-carboxymuconolactone decarboxylase